MAKTQIPCLKVRVGDLNCNTPYTVLVERIRQLIEAHNALLMLHERFACGGEGVEGLFDKLEAKVDSNAQWLTDIQELQEMQDLVG